ncbi:hypothetical protein NEOLEDRAFT_1140271 [Neolentinus lepideus HHB14362 ss-1]|uniref:Uncharacterized protein n=1 Tax=Neolentinus lepideus HHB14362 ss-1 TaxID=1314782 RepID=A0A165PA97_9AGAM|nr:hypothetical protein NEOLEDRAFT_1140271 [Neolentinus lepideus HHB14362 ss-1]
MVTLARFFEGYIVAFATRNSNLKLPESRARPRSILMILILLHCFLTVETRDEREWKALGESDAPGVSLSALRGT